MIASSWTKPSGRVSPSLTGPDLGIASDAPSWQSRGCLGSVSPTLHDDSAPWTAEGSENSSTSSASVLVEHNDIPFGLTHINCSTRTHRHFCLSQPFAIQESTIILLRHPFLGSLTRQSGK